MTSSDPQDGAIPPSRDCSSCSHNKIWRVFLRKIVFVTWGRRTVLFFLFKPTFPVQKCVFVPFLKDKTSSRIYSLYWPFLCQTEQLNITDLFTGITTAELLKVHTFHDAGERQCNLANKISANGILVPNHKSKNCQIWKSKGESDSLLPHRIETCGINDDDRC